MRGGDFDLLHFSGHGVADPKDIGSAKLLLTQVLEGGGAVKLRYLTARAVEQNARLRRELASAKLDLEIVKKAAAYFAKESR